MYTVRPATPADLPVLQEIERSAGQAFRGLGMDEVAEDQPFSLTELAGYQRAGLAWVVVAPPDHPVGYLVAEPVDGALHIEQASVHADHARQGAGRLLLDTLVEYAAGAAVPALTLTAFAEVPWNAPYYRQLGFQPIPDAEITPGLREIRRRETEAGLDRWPRICMRLAIGG